MNKAQFIEAIAKEADSSKAETARHLEAMIEVLTRSLASGEEITVVGFGKFFVRQTSARDGRNPRTGEKIRIAASNNPVFKAGKTLKDAVQ